MKLRHLPIGGAALALVLAAVIPLSQVRADKLIFGDGFVIEGKLNEKMTWIVDPATGISYSVPATGKPYWLDDGIRYIFFPPLRLKEALKDREKKLGQVQFVFGSPKGTNPLPPVWAAGNATDWDDRMEREVTLDTPNGKLKVKQRITGLTPEGMRVEALYYDWKSSYDLKELKPETLRSIVYKFAAMKEKKELDRRMTVYRFMLQADLMLEAEQELVGIQTEFPDEKSKVAPLLNDLRSLVALQVMEALERADKAGLHNEVESKLDFYARRKLGDFLDERAHLKVQALKDKMAEGRDKLSEARGLLQKFAELTDADKREFFKKAAADITRELNPDTVGRLNPFLSLATDYERAVKNKRDPEHKPNEVMSLALTGWLRGSDAAEKTVDVAVKQWQSRDLLLEYLRCDNAAVRRDNLLPALKDKMSVDEAIQFLRLLPPVEPFENISTKREQLQSTGIAKGVSYTLQLPPGYHHGRAWPVLMVLHHAVEKPSEAAARWVDMAAQHGYIVVAPHWGKSDKAAIYQFTSPEHAAVLDTLRDLRRRFQIDSDRVFLFGLEQGGNVAFDVGFSHPDQFAGVMPMCGTPNFFPGRYWTNAQLLNLYIVHGEAARPTVKETQLLVRDYFLRNNFAAIYFEYKGRGSNWFPAEQPNMFDWMNRKQRAQPLKELGKEGQEFRIHRDGDNQFYWLTASGIAPNRINTAKAWNPKINPATMRAKAFSNNEIHVRALGVNSVTLWFGPKFVEYNEKVALKFNDRPLVKQFITPSLDVLLERLYETGDRQQLFFAKVEMR